MDMYQKRKIRAEMKNNNQEDFQSAFFLHFIGEKQYKF